MTTLKLLDTQARKSGLRIRGALHPEPSDAAPAGTGTLVLIGPDEPAFWTVFTDSTEYSDGHPDPLDRWSKRVIGQMAQDWGGTAIFPSDGPPYPPFLAWARRSGQAWQSPIGLLVHDTAGLFISYRGVVALPGHLAVPIAAEIPCHGCEDRPCTTACPVSALNQGKDYDVPACQAHLRSPEGRDCLQGGCLARRACPAAIGFERLSAQSAFHMSAFLGE